MILVEAENDIGGHAIISGGNVPLGGGTSVQKQYGIEDSPDLLFRDLTDWSVVGPNGFPDYGTTIAKLFARSRTTALLPLNGWSTTASFLLTKPRMLLAATRSEIRCRAKCIAR